MKTLETQVLVPALVMARVMALVLVQAPRPDTGVCADINTGTGTWKRGADWSHYALCHDPPRKIFTTHGKS